MVGGLRGLPNVEGGIETHCEHLYARLAEVDCEITITARSPYVGKNPSWGKLQIKRIWSPTRNGLEAFLHTFLVVLYAGWKRPDVLHLHGIGPGLFTPLARLLGLKVVVTHHGPDYHREKWGKVATAVLKVGEMLSMQYASERIVISKTIADLVEQKYDLKSNLIPNGVVVQPGVEPGGCLRELELKAERYVLQVSRFVPEKRQLDLIAAFKEADLPGWKLVFAGRMTDDDYCRSVEDAAAGDERILFAGYRSGTELLELYSNAGIFVLPSAHEGLPIALLEAASFGLPIVASGIPANLEVGLDAEHYFRLGEVKELAQRLQLFSSREQTRDDKTQRIDWVRLNYDWDHIANSTHETYCRMLSAI